MCTKNIGLCFVVVIYYCILDKPEVSKYINYLYGRFVIVPVDKAIFFYCVQESISRCYKNVVGISDDANKIGNKVYKPIYQTDNDIYTFSWTKTSEYIWYEVTRHYKLPAWFYLDVIKNELGNFDDGNIVGKKVYKPIYQEANDM